jgi:hypothetical protein
VGGGDAGQVVVHCRCPVGSHEHEIEQPSGDVEPPPHPEFGSQEAPCSQPVGGGTGGGFGTVTGVVGGQISVTHCPF